MVLEQRFSAAQLASLALGCGLLAFGIITFDAIPVPESLSHAATKAVLWFGGLTLLFGIVAVVIMYKSLTAFQRGIDDGRWDQASLDKLKKRLNLPIATAFIWLLVAIAVGYVTIDLITHWFRNHSSNISGLAYFWMSPVFAIGRLRGSLNPKLPRGRSLWRDEVKPIHSDQWGHCGPSTPAA